MKSMKMERCLSMADKMDNPIFPDKPKEYTVCRACPYTERCLRVPERWTFIQSHCRFYKSFVEQDMIDRIIGERDK